MGLPVFGAPLRPSLPRDAVSVRSVSGPDRGRICLSGGRKGSSVRAGANTSSNGAVAISVRIGRNENLAEGDDAKRRAFPGARARRKRSPRGKRSGNAAPAQAPGESASVAGNAEATRPRCKHRGNSGNKVAAVAMRPRRKRRGNRGNRAAAVAAQPRRRRRRNSGGPCSPRVSAGEKARSLRRTLRQRGPGASTEGTRSPGLFARAPFVPILVRRSSRELRFPATHALRGAWWRGCRRSSRRRIRTPWKSQCGQRRRRSRTACPRSCRRESGWDCR